MLVEATGSRLMLGTKTGFWMVGDNATYTKKEMNMNSLLQTWAAAVQCKFLHVHFVLERAQCPAAILCCRPQCQICSPPVFCTEVYLSICLPIYWIYMDLLDSTPISISYTHSKSIPTTSLLWISLLSSQSKLGFPRLTLDKTQQASFILIYSKGQYTM